ncbi:3-hexulose-6-phosphate isomerase [Knoellia sinensis KCTC 19936]|uniref:3-hexulose-6-phosphate isomerase n=1 Tax=Knoellia sinensis KCTC 19936 TaxID=1385520 RepID=A0A0A0JBP0_9MICO|nr:tannase/feruloyl esterase family alpha/beta hydrolase [Knoellia sinensis]KGN34835.1 3-hexulose-6-phosphate isomerase [Knoellia sinensis KCTC 19936]
MRPTKTSPRTVLATLTALAATAALVVTAPPATADKATDKPGGGHCARQAKAQVPGAEMQKVACLDDLTTAGTVASGHTKPGDYAGLVTPGTVNPTGVPGIQIDGYFPDTSTTNVNNGWNHDSQFVIRIPDNWNGGLVVTGAPGNRTQYANDQVWSDFVLGQGYAFASTDKGNVGLNFWDDGSEPGGSVAEWHSRVTELTIASKKVLQKVKAKKPSRTWMAGISNGGYLVRWQLENRPDLYDGGLDWEGTLLRGDGPNLLTYLPAALKNYPAHAAGDAAAHDAIIAAGFEPGSEFLWPFHHQVYWDLTQRIYREEFDPEFDGDTKAGTPYCTSGTPQCDADYDYDSRPDEVKEAMRSVELTGDIKRPLISLQGDMDTLLPIKHTQEAYSALIADEGKTDMHRAYRVVGGTHTDALVPLFPNQLRSTLPCARAGFDALTAWVEDGTAPPASTTVPRPASGDLVNTCTL